MMIENKLEKIIKWASNDKRVKALLLVGSYARNTQKKDSDIDLVVITDNKENLFNLDWIDCYGKSIKHFFEEYGVCTSIRVFYEDNSEFEYGIVNTSWLDSPLDNGTRKVLSDGYILLYGSDGINKEMIETLLNK